jgi:hypothetical protein
VGDWNRDGVFNWSDLMLVFQAAEYEDGIAQFGVRRRRLELRPGVRLSGSGVRKINIAI